MSVSNDFATKMLAETFFYKNKKLEPLKCIIIKDSLNSFMNETYIFLQQNHTSWTGTTGDRAGTQG